MEYTKAIKTADGRAFFDLAEAQAHELFQLLAPHCTATPLGLADAQTEAFCGLLIKEAEKVADILTTTPTSRPKARKINGATRKAKVKPAAGTLPSPKDPA